MAGFNWFNRRFNSDKEEKSSDRAQADAQSENQAEQPAEESVEAAVPAETAVNQDYLTWAKAAYQNIKRQQGVVIDPTASSSEESPIATEEPKLASEDEFAEPIVEEPEPISQPVTESVAEVPAIDPAPEISPAAESPEPATASAVEAAVEPDAIEPELVEPESVEPELEPIAAVLDPVVESSNASAEEAEETESPAVALPFWAQAEAERQARLERLKAEAIEEPEPEPQPTVAATAEPAEEFLLDEGFMWSAEVLAAQGRRPDQVSVEEITWLKRLRQGLDKTRRSLVNQLKAIVGQGPLNQDAVIEIESLLLQADVGIEATDYIIEALQGKLREEALPPNEAIAYLKQILREMLDRPFTNAYSPTFAPEKDTLSIWLITGVNGAGKTTTIGKIAHLASKSDYRCLIGAADTFRAAAVEQVKVWGQRSGTEVIANPGKNTDPAAVVFDAIAAAESRNTELLLIDTAGRLQNKKNLMDELSKIRRIIDKKAPNAHVESLLVLDATLGQNGLKQAQVFAEAAKLSGVVLTKLDGTARGGIALAVVQQLGLPIRFLGAGEGIEDLRPFSSYEFVEALLS